MKLSGYTIVDIGQEEDKLLSQFSEQAGYYLQQALTFREYSKKKTAGSYYAKEMLNYFYIEQNNKKIPFGEFVLSDNCNITFFERMLAKMNAKFIPVISTALTIGSSDPETELWLDWMNKSDINERVKTAANGWTAKDGTETKPEELMWIDLAYSDKAYTLYEQLQNFANVYKESVQVKETKGLKGVTREDQDALAGMTEAQAEKALEDVTADQAASAAELDVYERLNAFTTKSGEKLGEFFVRMGSMKVDREGNLRELYSMVDGLSTAQFASVKTSGVEGLLKTLTVSGFNEESFKKLRSECYKKLSELGLGEGINVWEDCVDSSKIVAQTTEFIRQNKAGKLNTEYEESLVTHLTKWDKAMAIIEITSMIYSGIWMITDGLVKLATGATFTAVVWGWATTLWAMGGIAGEEKDNGAQAKRDPSMIYQRKQYISGIYVGVGDTHAKAIAAVYAKIAAASGKTTLLSELDEVVFYSLGSKIGNTWYRRSGAKEEGEKYAYIGVTRTDSRSEAIYGLLKYYTDSDNNPEELTVNAKCRNLLTEEGRIVLDKNTTLSPEAFEHNYRSFKADYEYDNKKIVPEAHAKFEEGYDLALSNADKARMWEYIGAGVSIAFGLMAVAGGIMKIIELATYYDPEFEQIPRYIVDEKDITRQDESGFTIVLHNDYAYYKIVTCNRKAKGTSGDADHNWWTSGAQKNVDKYTEWGCGDYSDLNGDVGKQWLSLYYSKNENENPIIADSLKAVVGSKDIPAGYETGIHMFGEDTSFNLNNSLYVWDDSADSVNVYFKTDSAASSMD